MTVLIFFLFFENTFAEHQDYQLCAVRHSETAELVWIKRGILNLQYILPNVLIYHQHQHHHHYQKDDDH
jgi:hypothetical protein